MTPHSEASLSNTVEVIKSTIAAVDATGRRRLTGGGGKKRLLGVTDNVDVTFEVEAEIQTGSDGQPSAAATFSSMTSAINDKVSSTDGDSISDTVQAQVTRASTHSDCSTFKVLLSTITRSLPACTMN